MIPIEGFPKHDTLSKAKTKVQAGVSFLKGFTDECVHGMAFNHQVREKLVNELKLRDVDIEDPSMSKDWELFDKKLLRFRPRLIGAIASYTLLSEHTYSEVAAQSGMLPFRTLWALGAIQDDLIDELPKADMAAMNTNQDRVRRLREVIFGKDRVFYQAAYATIIDELNKSGVYSDLQRRYLTTTMANWFRFLLKQEAEVFSIKDANYGFDFSKRYREEQDYEIGKALVACLNGVNCLDPKYQWIEEILPFLSYRSQMIDDVGDTGEDLVLGRPSYVVGALREYPDELAVVRRIVDTNKVGKFTPRLLRKIAPKSYSLVNDTFVSYGVELSERYGAKAQILDFAGYAAYHAFPVVRDVMNHINPRYANF